MHREYLGHASDFLVLERKLSYFGFLGNVFTRCREVLSAFWLLWGVIMISGVIMVGNLEEYDMVLCEVCCSRGNT